MRLQPGQRLALCLLTAAFAAGVAGPVWAQHAAPDRPAEAARALDPLDELLEPAPDAALLPGDAVGVWPAPEAAGPQAEPGGAPSLGEATGKAVSEVLGAARRDSASWARRVTDTKDRLLARALEAWARFSDDPVRTTDVWLAQAGLPDSQTLAGPALGLVLALALLLALLRGSGDLKVSIEYPAELRGTFTVKVSRKKTRRSGPRNASPAAAERAKRKASASSRSERHLVSRETDFLGIRTGRWFVSVDGFVQPAEGDNVIATFLEEQEIRVRRGHTVRLDFNFHPRQCPVDVKVLWDKRPVNDALVAWRGQPHSLRYARGGPLRMGAERGEHTLVVGSGDRVAELPVSITSFQAQPLEIDLSDRERLIFNGCPPAVEPYLHGDLPAAARALEREGQAEIAHLLLAWVAEERDQPLQAAQHYKQAGLPSEAAEIQRTLHRFSESAELYESAGEPALAGEMYRSAGELAKAGEAYERARDYQSAAECFRESGAVTRWCDALERDGRPFEAAQVALDHGDPGRAIRSLQALSPSDGHYVEAANLLVDVLQREGHLDLAVEKVEEVIRTQGADQVPLETCDRLAALLEEGDELERALDVLEIIRRRDASWPSLATRMEELRKKQQAKSGAAAERAAFQGGLRYEILEEIGRGGMGIVFKARDRRLGRVVALKRLPENLKNHPKAVELFLREARSCASLNHPNIVTVHDAGQEGDSFYITMELLEGRPLQEILKVNGTLGPRDVAKLGLQVCSGLDYAHQQRIIHRDIKTANLFFTRAKVLKIMDFGLAKMVEEVRRAATVIGGTPYYMAPEQSLGKAVDHRADLYALGVTFFELLTGKVPFPEGDVAYHHRHSPAPDPRDQQAGIPDAMAELVLDMLAKDPQARPESAAVVAQRLQALLDAPRATASLAETQPTVPDEPADPQPADTQPTDTQPTDTQPTDTQPTDPNEPS